MYQRREISGAISEHFLKGVQVFIEFAISNIANDEEIRCPCSRCKLLNYLEPNMAKVHLRQFGFVPNYLLWDRHGEIVAPNNQEQSVEVISEEGSTNLIEHMVEDAARSMFPTAVIDNDDVNVEEEPNVGAKKIYDLLDHAKKPLWNGCLSGSQLSVTAEYIAMKSKYNLT